MKSRMIVFIGLAIVCLVVAAICIIVAIAATQFGPLKQARVTATATRTPQPTYTATPIQTATPVSSPTPIPSLTPTATLTLPPTDTAVPSPIPTETLPPTPVATHTQAPPPSPQATATATVKPTRRPTRRPTNTPVPPPTNTPPPPFTGNVVGGWANCSWDGVEGDVRHANKDPYADVAVGIWSDAWPGRVTRTEPSGKFSLSIRSVELGKFYVAVVQWETCPQQGDDRTAVECKYLSNRVEITITEHCEGAGASNSAKVDFTGP